MKPLEVLLLPAYIYGKDEKKLLTVRFGPSALLRPSVLEPEASLAECGSYSEPGYYSTSARKCPAPTAKDYGLHKVQVTPAQKGLAFRVMKGG